MPPDLWSRRVKGNRVKCPDDLVTVIGECGTMRFCAVTDFIIGKAVPCDDP